MFLVAGLGNIGDKYTHTRHNAGFLVLDELCRSHRWERCTTCNTDYIISMVEGEQVLFLKPRTMMNLSGEAISCRSTRHEIAPEKIIIIYDDIDLPFGEFRISFARGSGGHNGVQSIIDVLGTNRFIRIRIGIAPITLFGKMKKPAVVDRFVLGAFPRSKIKMLKRLSQDISAALHLIIKEGKDSAMNRYN